MKTKRFFDPSPKVSVSEDTTTLSYTISYDCTDLKLESLTFVNFIVYAKKRFPKLSHEDECVSIKVEIILPNDHRLASDAEEETCDLISSIVGNSLLIFNKGISVGFQKELSTKEEIPSLMDQTLKLIQALSIDIDTMRGMKIHIAMVRKTKMSIWAFE